MLNRSPSGAQNRFLSTGLEDHSSLLRMNYWIEFLFEFLVSDVVLEGLVSDFLGLILCVEFLW